jgi:hypothetical protein
MKRLAGGGGGIEVVVRGGGEHADVVTEALQLTRQIGHQICCGDAVR